MLFLLQNLFFALLIGMLYHGLCVSFYQVIKKYADKQEEDGTEDQSEENESETDDPKKQEVEDTDEDIKS